MKIVAVVSSCVDCPNRARYSRGRYECTRAEVVLPEDADRRIPTWCPLDDYPAAEAPCHADGHAAGQLVWLPIDAAPRDGTPFWAISAEAENPIPRVTFYGMGFQLVTAAEKFAYTNPTRWWPTHYAEMQVPAPPLVVRAEEK